jgi:hypothetical protein
LGRDATRAAIRAAWSLERDNRDDAEFRTTLLALLMISTGSYMPFLFRTGLVRSVLLRRGANSLGVIWLS